MAISIGEVDVSNLAISSELVSKASIGESLVFSSFEPFTQENLTLTAQPVPAGAAGAWVTAIGGGAAGSTGASGNQITISGEPGGGAGARLNRTWVDRSLMGDTYSMQQGLGGNGNTAPGTASKFTSGMLSLVANGGTGTVGGLPTASGVTATGLQGCAADTSDLVNNAPAGGGSSGGYAGGAGQPGLPGGSSLHATGGTTPSGTPTSAGAGNGGAGGGGGSGAVFANGAPGGAGGLYGGGGGAGGSANAGSGGLFGKGGIGYILVEWTAAAPSVPAPSISLTEVAPRHLTVNLVGLPQGFGIVTGFNFKLNGTTDNAHPVKQPTYSFTDVVPSTAYRITATAVNAAGTESAVYPEIQATTLVDDLITADQQTGIDEIVARTMPLGGGATAAIFATTGPAGSYQKAYGTSLNAHFRIASATKPFNGHAVLMAVDKGLISLDDKLSKYLSGYQSDPTLKNMMMMRSGLFDYELSPNLGQTFTLNPLTPMTVDQIIAIIQANASGFEPDAAYQYTNSNHYVLAKILEKVDPHSRTWEQIITQDILSPLGLTETYCPVNDFGIKSPVMAGFDNGPLGLGLFGKRDVTNQNNYFTWAAGDIISTVGDLLKWAQELMHGTLLSPESQALRFSTFDQVPQVPAMGYENEGPPTFGYGLALLSYGSWFGHDGSWIGYENGVMIQPETGAVIVSVQNLQTTGLLALADTWYEAAEFLYPGSASGFNYGKTLTITPTSIPPSSTFGTVNLINGAPRGDEDGTIGIPHKVPYII